MVLCNFFLFSFSIILSSHCTVAQTLQLSQDRNIYEIDLPAKRGTLNDTHRKNHLLFIHFSRTSSIFLVELEFDFLFDFIFFGKILIFLIEQKPTMNLFFSPKSVCENEMCNFKQNFPLSIFQQCNFSRYLVKVFFVFFFVNVKWKKNPLNWSLVYIGTIKLSIILFYYCNLK